MQKNLNILRIEEGKFRFKGIDIKKVGDKIEVIMNYYANNLETVTLYMVDEMKS